MPASAITFGIEPRDAMPMSAHAVQSIAIPRVLLATAQVGDRLAQEVVGGAVVGLGGVAEARRRSS